MHRIICLALSVLLVASGVFASDSLAQSAPDDHEVFALTWDAIPEETRNLYPLVWERNPQDAAQKLAKRPAGHRAVIFNWGEVFRLVEHPGDRCVLTALHTALTGGPQQHIYVEPIPYDVPAGRPIVLKSPYKSAVVYATEDASARDTVLAVGDGEGNPIDVIAEPGTKVLGPYQCPWVDEGAERARDRQMKPWFSSLAATGADLDYVIMDYEEMFRQSGMDAEKVAAIQADPRSEGLQQKLSPHALDDVLTNEDARARFNAITDGYIANALNTAIFEVAREFYPNVEMSNYSNSGITEEEATWNRHGNYAYSPAVVGTHASHFMYGIVGNLRREQVDGSRYGHGPFEALKLDVQTARSMRRSGNPIMPWVAPKSWHRDNITHYDQTAYYDELIFHLALTGADPFLFWNSKAGDDDEWTVDSLLSEVNRELRPGPHVLVTEDQFDWDASVLVTGAKTEREYVYRITVASPFQRVVAFPRQDTIEVDEGRGTWYRTTFQPDSFSVSEEIRGRR